MKRNGILILFLVAALVLTVACSSRTFNAEELILIRVSGANGFASAHVNTDRAAVEALLAEESAKLDEGDEKGLQRHFQREAALNSLVFTVDRTEGLKNGDELSIRADYDHQLAKDAGIRFRNVRFKYKVEGLKEAQPIDVKGQVALTFSGYDGRGLAALSLSGDLDLYKTDFDFVFSYGKTGLSNGDSVELKVIPDNRALTAKGKIAREQTLVFDVRGLPSLADVDLFEDLVLIFDGVSDQGVVTFDTSRLPAEWVEAGMPDELPVQFTALPSSGLANGDLVRIKALVDEDWFAERGLTATVTEKEFQVTGLKEYPRNLDGVDLVPLFEKIEPWLERDLAGRLDMNYWNKDVKTGDPVSRWDYRFNQGVIRLFYGYDQTDRSHNFLAILLKVSVDAVCLETVPYQSYYEPGDRESSTLYLLYLIEEVMYDRPLVEDFREINLRFHGDVELDLISGFKGQYGGNQMLIVDVPVPADYEYDQAVTPVVP